MEHWKRRIFTPIVIKTLLIPKLNHLFISLPTPKKRRLLNLYAQLFLSFYGNPKQLKGVFQPKTTCQEVLKWWMYGILLHFSEMFMD